MYKAVKWVLDELLAFTGLLILSLPLLLIALLIKIDSPGPVLFTQRRVGKNRRLFTIYKFRTMRSDAPSEVPTHLLKDPGQMITKTGRFLRKTSLDEIPQLFNILLGQMSFIGPRPALWNQDDLIAIREEYGVHALRPGLTGWAQVNGRDELPIEVKARFDGEYVQKIGFIMDVRILFRTVIQVLGSRGVVEGTKQEGRM